MKKLLLIIGLTLLLSSCATIEDFPEMQKNQKHQAPYGTPDDTQVYNSSKYSTITYIYYCYQGQYVAVTYTCDDYQYNCIWTRSIYTSSCIK